MEGGTETGKVLRSFLLRKRYLFKQIYMVVEYRARVARHVPLLLLTLGHHVVPFLWYPHRVTGAQLGRIPLSSEMGMGIVLEYDE